ncbi:sugar kinase [Actinoallomurus iriomotensis]|uniref:Sugar kinase n=1 Tax=Actinoallomurus iriomotensis TaxID=478107 RepID=A0A9W6S6I5_9ACTN|nr:sugar kinase [Actinoallomurus iriomotensis]GLY87989.1 sugar kinase [Actinoallomurus iriomotensis]
MGGLLTLGEAMVTFTPEQIGSLRHVRSLTASMAGSEATVAIAVRRLGHPATWVSRLGDDEPGELVLDRMRAEDLTLYVRRGPGPTGLMLKESPRAGARRAHYYRSGSAAASLRPDDLPPGLVESAAVLHVSGITMALGESPRHTVRSAVDRARAAGAMVSFDVNHRRRLWSATDARAHVTELLPHVDIAFASVSEARLLLDGATINVHDLADALRELGPGAVVVTDGPAGAVVADDHGTVHIPALAATEIDPFGAGDAFVGGSIAGLLDGMKLADAAALGSAVAAQAVAAPGDWEGLPTRGELAAARESDIDR